jgi:uncharacterized membrane protein YidH (DUF202 family)
MPEKGDAATFHLAVLRTELANSSTLMSHIRASIGLLITAVGFMKLLDSYLIFDLCGWLFILMALAVTLRGILLYRKTRSKIENEGSWLTDSPLNSEGL